MSGDLKLDDLFALQEQITMAVMAAVNVKFNVGETASLKKPCLMHTVMRG